MTRPAQEGPDPREFFRLLWRRKWILLPCLILIPFATYVVSTRLPKTYQASTVLQLGATASDGSISPTGDFTASSDSQQDSDKAAALIETNGVADQAAALLHEPRGSLRGAVKASADQDTGFITVTASASSARRAARIANTFADAVQVTRARQGVKRVQTAISTVQSNLAKLKPSDTVTKQQLNQQLQQLQALRAAQSQNAQVIQAAVPPAGPASPHPARNAIIALVVALVIGALLVALVDRMDRKVHDPDELEKLSGSPLLVHLPPGAFPGSPPDPNVPLAVQMLRDSLTYFNVDRELDSLIVVSSLKGEGKTTVAANLAVSFARAGKRVVALDADLRSPQLGPRLGADRAPGLSDVLAGADLHDALREVEPFGAALRVLPGGPPPPNPSELLGSRRMAAIFEEIRRSSDLVIIDTPPLLVVSDAFGLLERVSGAIGVARVDQTPREAVARMAEVTRTVGARLLGMAATGGGLGHGYGYGYGYGYGAAPAAAAAPAPPVVDPPVVEASLNGKGGVPAQTPQDQLSAEGKSRPSRVSQLFRSS